MALSTLQEPHLTGTRPGPIPPIATEKPLRRQLTAAEFYQLYKDQCMTKTELIDAIAAGVDGMTKV